MKIVFMATGDIALPTLDALLSSEHEVLALYTQPDKPVGRKQVLTAPRVKTLALEAQVPVFQPAKVGEVGVIEALAALRPDVIVVMAYGQILPQSLIDIAEVAIINLHASLLPKYRGASCIQAAIDAGDEKTGMTVMHVVKQLDAGDMIRTAELPLTGSSTGGVVHDALAELSPGLLLEVLAELDAGTASRKPQSDELASYAPKLLRADGELEWSETACALERRIRAYDPWPGTFTTYQDKKGKTRRLKVFPPTRVVDDLAGEALPAGTIIEQEGRLLVSCGSGLLELHRVQPDGGKPLEAKVFLNAQKENGLKTLGV